ncbi:hypothetical protein KL928_000559 [Ogataea angusta]|uniref:Transmembrane protein n=1 Tax=Pichia angusta TaxID=870730 RepID=A0AAN6I8D2_PICAN|nr:uncharacterized protein KL928_000559 [Ogataea angusta]KAG7822084.1 hypothetical protein KL928_000559 [Ogataea angusta]
MTNSNAASAAALAGKLRRMLGANPRVNPRRPRSAYTCFTASKYRLYLGFFTSSIMITFFTTSAGYAVIQKHPRCDQLVRPPPDNEVGAENHGRHEALVQRAEAVVSDQFDQTVDRPGELPGFRVVLDLQPRLQLFYRRSHKGHGESRSEAGQTAACKGQFFLCWVQVVLDEPAVQGERAEHDGVHEHPAHERRREALVESPNSFVAQSFQRAVDGAFEAALGGLETHFDGVERVADRVLHDAREHARDEPGVPRRVARVCGHGEK